MVGDIVKQLIELSTIPADKKAFEAWTAMADAITFLKGNARNDEIVI
jgi:hypothetical protein